MDDPEGFILYDPQRDGYDLVDILMHAAAEAAEHGPAAHSPPSSAPEGMRPISFDQPPGFKDPGPIKGPRLGATAQPLPELGVVILRAQNKEDMEEILKLVTIIQEYANQAEVVIDVLNVEVGDAASIATYLKSLFSSVQIYPNVTEITPVKTGAVGAGGAAGGGAAVQQPSSTVFIQVLPRTNQLLVAAARVRMDEIRKQVAAMDKLPTDLTRGQWFYLRRQSASRVANIIQNFWNLRYQPVETLQNSLVRVTYDDQTNALFVQAAPADMAEIKAFIEQIDGRSDEAVPGQQGVNQARNDMKVIRVKNALSDDLASLLVTALTQMVYQGALPSGALPGAGGVAGGGAAPAVAPAGGAGAAGKGGTLSQIIGSGTTIKGTSLRFLPERRPGTPSPGEVYAQVFEDVHVYSDTRTNSLLISAQPDTMRLIEALINDLDVPPQYAASVNVFTLKRADALAVANILQTLFLGTAPAGGAGAKGAAAGGAGGTQQGPLIPAGPEGQAPGGPLLIPVRITIDDRSNSIIAAGTPSDLQLIGIIIQRLETTNEPRRQTEIVQVYNAQAVDIATTLTTLYTNSLNVYNVAGQKTAFLELQRDVVIVADAVSNQIAINASPEYMGDIIRNIARLDYLPPVIRIDTLVAEVDLIDIEEFGVELGLQSPVLFRRSITGAVTTNPVGTIQPAAPATTVGFPFNTTAPLGNNVLVSPAQVGIQGINNLAVGRVSPTAGVGGFVFSMASDSFSLLIRALQTVDRLEILSAPSVTTCDNQAARILVGQNFPYISGSVVTTATTGIPTITNTVLYKDIGVQLQVTPKISPDGTVIMRVVPEVSSAVTSTVQISTGVFATAFNTQTVETTVVCKDGETVAIGGMIQRTDDKKENKIPWLGDLPWVGAAFRYRQELKNRKEFLVILTPHVARCRADRTANLLEAAGMRTWTLPEATKTFGIRNMEPLLPRPGVSGLPANPDLFGNAILPNPGSNPGGPGMPGDPGAPGGPGCLPPPGVPQPPMPVMPGVQPEMAPLPQVQPGFPGGAGNMPQAPMPQFSAPPQQAMPVGQGYPQTTFPQNQVGQLPR